MRLIIAIIAAACLSGCATIPGTNTQTSGIGDLLAPLLQLVERYKADPPEDVLGMGQLPAAETIATNKPILTSQSKYHNVDDYRVACDMIIDPDSITGSMFRWSTHPSPPWSDWKISTWRAQYEIVVMVEEDDCFRLYWADYGERGKEVRQWSEMQYHITEDQGGPILDGLTVWICVCDGDRSRKGTQRSKWVQFKKE